MNALFSEVNPIPVNAALAAMGFGKGGVRLPLTPMEDCRRAVLLEEMKRLGVPGMKILINGAAGAMGLELCRLLQAHYAGGEVAALVDPKGGQGIYPSFSQVPDVQGTVLDFSFHTATGAAVDYAVDHGLPLVVGDHRPRPGRAGPHFGCRQPDSLFYSGNMSLGIAVLCRLVKDAVRFFPQADVEILEVHHNRKADAPSGTALMLAEAVRSQRPEATVLCGRSGASKRELWGKSAFPRYVWATPWAFTR